jgi:transposase
VLLELTVAEQRFNAVMEVLRDGLTVIEVAERYRVSRQAVHGWLRRYRTGGLEALADRSHRPNSCPHQMPAAIEARLCELRRRHPQWGQRRLAHELVRDGVDPPPGLTSIYRALIRNGLIQPKARRRRKADYRRWERARPMELWQLDVMGGIWLVDGRELKAVTGIDDHSRFCVAAGLVERANARSVCRVSPRPWPATAAPRKSSPTTARSSAAALALIPARCCSTASAASKGSPTGAPGSAARPPPARSNASTRPCGPSCSPAAASTPSTTPNRSWMPGLTTTTPSAPTRPSPWPSRPDASSRRPPRRPRSRRFNHASRSPSVRPRSPAGCRPAA